MMMLMRRMKYSNLSLMSCTDIMNKNSTRQILFCSKKIRRMGGVSSIVPRSISEPAKKYGTTFVGSYYAVYFSTLAGMYVAVDKGLIVPKDATSKLKEWGLTVEEINPKQGSLFAAWILTKFTEPVRAAFTLVITPPIANHLRKIIPRSNASWSPRGILGILVSVFVAELCLLRCMGQKDEEEENDEE